VTSPKPHKYQRIFNLLHSEIQSGRFGPGDRLPSEAELVERFGASRITVGRAMKDLQQRGLVDRRAGSGTYVKTKGAEAGALSFGLLIPDLGETEIFEPICQGMMASSLARTHVLMWGSVHRTSGASAERAWELCHQYIDRKVSGVFFAPLEFAPTKDAVNGGIVAALGKAGIPVVLLDRPIGRYPEPGTLDLVALDNRRAGYVIAEHLLRSGARRVAFVGRPNAAATVDARAAGYREALLASGAACEPGFIQRIEPGDATSVQGMMNSIRPDGIVCGNDQTAARLMHSLMSLGYSVPDDCRLGGVDDLQYASLLPVPLTTIRQPTRQIGETALAAMLDRIAGLDLPPREILIHGSLIVRKSCGSGRVEKAPPSSPGRRGEPSAEKTSPKPATS
jgi:GntR family transcriptional regulator of arabinose operon